MPENKDDIDLEGWDLHRAARENRVDIARVLIERGAEVDAKDNNGWTPLHHAADNNSLGVARLLTEEDAEVDAKNNDGWTPLHIAAMEDFLDVARLLIERRADIEAEDEDGRTPLFWASYFKARTVARLLIERGADTQGIDLSWMDSPLLIAVKNQDFDAVTSLLRVLRRYLAFGLPRRDARPDIEFVDREGNTPLLVAVKSHFLPIAKLLANNGANCETVDGKGKTILEVLNNELSQPDRFKSSEQLNGFQLFRYAISIAITVKDYFSPITPETVENWISQFDSKVQLTVLRELDHVLKQTYISRRKITETISKVINGPNVTVGYSDPAEFWRAATLIQPGPPGGSHSVL